MLRTSIVVSIILLSTPGLASEQALDEDFLLWLGQIAELEELGMDINQLIEQEDETTDAKQEEQSK